MSIKVPAETVCASISDIQFQRRPPFLPPVHIPTSDVPIYTCMQCTSVQGELEFRPISYTPWPVDASYEGARVRVAVGEIRSRQPRWAQVARRPAGSGF